MKLLTTKLIIGAVLIGGNIAFGAEQFDPASGIVCKKPKSDLYQKENLNEATNLELIADFKKIKRYEDAIKGILRYTDAKDGVQVLPVLLKPRGNSRGSNCEFKPFRMSFTLPKTAVEIHKLLSGKNIDFNSLEYLKSFYNEFVAMKYDLNSEAKFSQGSLFNKLGDDIKVVTHCGKDSYGEDWPGGLKEIDQDQRLLAEYYVYEALAKLQWPVETVKLAKIKYYNADGTPAFSDPQSRSEALPKLAFFREPPTSLAKRCHLQSKKPTKIPDPDIKGNGIAVEVNNSLSEFLVTVINRFVINTDFNLGYDGAKQGHNVNFLYNETGQKFFGAYDFDLAGAVNPTRGQATKNEFKNVIDRGADSYVSNLSGYKDTAMALAVAKRIVQAGPEMKAVIESSLLNGEYKEKATYWLETQLNTTEQAIKILEKRIEGKK